MAKLLKMPDGVRTPEIETSMSFEAMLAAEDKFIKKLREVLRKRCPDSLVGAIVGTPVADGRAVYMVATEKPLQLVHVPVGDAWHADPVWIRGLKLSDIRRMTGTLGGRAAR